MCGGADAEYAIAEVRVLTLHFCLPRNNLLRYRINRQTVSVEISYNVCNT